MIPERREAVLAALADGPMTTTEIVRSCGLTKSVVLRYAGHLAEEGAVIAEAGRPTSKGVAGVPTVWRLA